MYKRLGYLAAGVVVGLAVTGYLVNKEIREKKEEAEGTVTEAEYLEKLNGFVTRNTDHVKNSSYGGALRGMFERDRQFYKTPVKNTSSRYRKRNSDNKHKEKAGKKE